MYTKSLIFGVKEIDFLKKRLGNFVGYVVDYDGNIIAFVKQN